MDLQTNRQEKNTHATSEKNRQLLQALCVRGIRNAAKLVKLKKATVESAIDIGISAKIIVGKSYNFENILPIGIQLLS